MLGENIEDQGRPVDDLGVNDVLQPAALRGGQLLVDDDGVGLNATYDLGQLASLAGPQVGSRIGLHATLNDAVEDARTGGLRERGQLAQRVFGFLFALRGAQAHENDLFESHLAVFDLGDVLTVGGAGVDAARARSSLALKSTRVLGRVLTRRRCERCSRAREDTRDNVVDALVALLFRRVRTCVGRVHNHPFRGDF